MSSNVIKVRKAEGKIKQLVQVNANSFFADEPEPIGNGEGPNPHDLLDASLGVCTAMTVMMVAQRKQWPLQDVRVEITHEEDEANYKMLRKIELVGALTEEQRTYLMGIANKCPIHKALHKKFEVESSLVA
ncbi:OsmC family protein [Nevskia soli]|uniref:OsmC family protein n=1 Tax=Nevskia soli TaxID=418856 RepID=UPI000569CDB8|nr:OsmC family protein [Nevskia soli]